MPSYNVPLHRRSLSLFVLSLTMFLVGMAAVHQKPATANANSSKRLKNALRDEILIRKITLTRGFSADPNIALFDVKILYNRRVSASDTSTVEITADQSDVTFPPAASKNTLTLPLPKEKDSSSLSMMVPRQEKTRKIKLTVRLGKQTKKITIPVEPLSGAHTVPISAQADSSMLATVQENAALTVGFQDNSSHTDTYYTLSEVPAGATVTLDPTGSVSNMTNQSIGTDTYRLEGPPADDQGRVQPQKVMIKPPYGGWTGNLSLKVRKKAGDTTGDTISVFIAVPSASSPSDPTHP